MTRPDLYGLKVKPPPCPCCGARARAWVQLADNRYGRGLFCQDCINAADAIKAGRPLPKIGRRS
jgi:hypothetical protein